MVRNTLTAAALPVLLGMPALALAHADPDSFSESAFVEEAAIVDCTLENGVETQCHEFTVGYQPQDLEIGPFCPENLDEEGGIWGWDGDEAGLYRLDRAFFEMLAEQGYRFYDENGDIAISDPGSGARPTADHACLMATADESVIITMRLPVEPMLADESSELGTVAQVGVALDGVPIFADAPSVLETGHLPALDVCGGHIDPGGWYHWHATATDVDTMLDHEDVQGDCAVTQDPSAVFGYAFDGFPMFGSLEADGSEPQGLDPCNGHVGETAMGETYHYHASKDYPNLPSCLAGVVAENRFATTADNGIGAANGGGAGPGGNGMPPGMEEAARTLGVSAEDLMQALGGGGPGQAPDLSAAAETLGLSEQALRDALPRRP